MEDLFEILQGTWKSKEEIEVLPYKSNFSNWIDASPVPGFFRFQLYYDEAEKQKIASVGIPIQGRFPQKGHYNIFLGKFDIKKDKIFIGQDEKKATKISYQLSTDRTILELKLFGKNIEFEKQE